MTKDLDLQYIRLAVMEYLQAAVEGTEFQYDQARVAFTEARLRLSDALDHVRDRAHAERTRRRGHA